MTVTNETTDTIAAIATAAGRGGIGIIRISGPDSYRIGMLITGRELKPRYAHYTPFFENDGNTIDQGLAIFFPNPDSFTGEDVVELQGHGGPVVLDLLLQQVINAGARLANPGEFSERAYLNDKIDLTQAEAIADLIDATSQASARSAMRSLEGEFSRQVDSLVEGLIHLRMYVEAAIDFPEEEIDFLEDGKVALDLNNLIKELQQILERAQQGTLLRDGINIVIAGRPNAGKSSLLNALSGRDSAIVTDIAGTTRDILREQIQIDGMPVHIIDTAGLRDAPDTVEKIGIERAWKEIERADRVLLIVDATTTASTNPFDIYPEFVDQLPHPERITVVQNKCDLLQGSSKDQVEIDTDHPPVVRISAKAGEGIDQLRQHLKELVGYHGISEGSFAARRRHLTALQAAYQQMLTGKEQLLMASAGELLAEDLRLAQQQLEQITGRYTPDDLLGAIFSSFCIGK